MNDLILSLGSGGMGINIDAAWSDGDRAFTRVAGRLLVEEIDLWAVQPRGTYVVPGMWHEHLYEQASMAPGRAQMARPQKAKHTRAAAPGNDPRREEQPAPAALPHVEAPRTT